MIYIAPLKALVRERIEDWSNWLCKKLGKKIVELTGDYTPDLRALLAADIIIATPEKWDGISRNWQTRGYVKKARKSAVWAWFLFKKYGRLDHSASLSETCTLSTDRGSLVHVRKENWRGI